MFGAIRSVLDAGLSDLLDIAADFSPRYERRGPATVVLDLTGLERLFGSPRAIAEELRRAGKERGIPLRVAIAATCTAAHLLSMGRHPIVVIEPGTEADALAGIPLQALQALDAVHPSTAAPVNLLSTFHRWGLRTLGDLAALPVDAVSARVGRDGVRWHRLARGEDLRPLRPEVPDERFEEAFDLEWPIEGLEPLSFVLGRLLDPLAAHLERRGRGAAVLHLRLHLVTRVLYERSLQLPAAMRDAKTLRTLLLLDLESHPPPAAIDRVVVAAEPTPARVLQFSLLTRPLPSPEQLSTLMARLGALMGEDRCGSPQEVDSWEPGVFAMRAFHPSDKPQSGPCASVSQRPASTLRRFRSPVPARVRVEEGTPIVVRTDRRGLGGGHVRAWAGPWRTSGDWWQPSPWDRDEWDVTLSDGATYRVFRERGGGGWFLEGIYD